MLMLKEAKRKMMSDNQENRSERNKKNKDMFERKK